MQEIEEMTTEFVPMDLGKIREWRIRAGGRICRHTIITLSKYVEKTKSAAQDDTCIAQNAVRAS